MPFLTEPSRRIPITDHCDVLVAGGGAAGYCAAIAAAREGARTVLVERSAMLGGSATQALVLPLMTFHASPRRQVVAGIAQELVDLLKAEGASPGHIPDPLGCAATVTPMDPEALKLAVCRLVADSGARTLLDTLVTTPWMTGRRVVGAVVENKSGRSAIKAKVVVDATGDADVAAAAGVPFSFGRGRDNKAQPMTLMFRMAGVDSAAVRRYCRAHPEEFVLSPEARRGLGRLPFLAVSGFFSLVRKAQADGILGPFRDRVLYFELPAPGEVLVNMTRVSGLSGVDAAQSSAAALAALFQVREAAAFMRTRLPGFSHSRLVETASRVGVRETRRIQGRCTLTAEDVLEGRDFPDSVARGAFPIDLHDPEGAGLTMKRMKAGASYGIPYRCLLPKAVEGLLVAGRAISATHEANASARLSPTCMALGQAAGTAGALCAAAGVLPSRLDCGLLRRKLKSRGAVI
ncbi:MAG: FAD-dependent oxidoreductase [Elusimicrobiota bacterium]|jgi:hypothetical protein